MKGLLLKDLLNQRMYVKSIGVVLLFFLVIGILQRSVEGIVSMFATMLLVFTMVAAVNSIALDDACKWNCYAAAMPLKRVDIVRGKYLMFVLLDVGGGVLIALIGLAAALFLEIDRNMLLLTVGGVVLLCLFLLSVLLPLIYKFGAEKARFIIIGVALLPTLLLLLLKSVGIENPFTSGAIDWASLSWLVWALPVGVLALLLGSYALSARIFSHKDL